ncbi:MAG: magnesium transporter, partial [Longimicrobiales bacterium]
MSTVGDTPTRERDPRERIERVQGLIARRDRTALAAFVAEFHPSDVADILEALDEPERLYLLELLPAELASESLAEMESGERPEEILASLDPVRIGELVGQLSDDDAVDLIQELEPDEQARVLAALPGIEAGELRKLLQYPDDSAGGIMTTELVAVSVHLTAGEAIEAVRRQARELGSEFYTVFVVDYFRRLRGTISLHDLVLAEPSTRLEELVEPPIATVPVDLDQEEVGRIIARYNLPSIGVVGPDNILLGRITWDDVMDVIEAEQTEDLLRLAGTTADEELRGGWLETVRSRLPWLGLNLITAGVAASVVVLFADTIEAMALLAAIMPVIAGMGGNAGTQALAVTVRRLALADEPGGRWGVVGKEMLVGLFNGLVLGVVIGALSFIWQGSAMLGVVVLLAMWGNLVVASVAGAFVPTLLESVGVDPAVASSVFVTAFTDIAGFFLLLGLASVILL